MYILSRSFFSLVLAAPLLSSPLLFLLRHHTPHPFACSCPRLLRVPRSRPEYRLPRARGETSPFERRP